MSIINSYTPERLNIDCFTVLWDNYVSSVTVGLSLFYGGSIEEGLAFFHKHIERVRLVSLSIAIN